MSGKRVLCALAITAGSLAFTTVQAEQGTAFGTGGTASARLDFQVQIPRVLFFRVGAADNDADTVVFDFVTTPAGLGSGTPIDATSGPVPVEIRGNFTASATITSSGGSALARTGGGTPIPLSDISGTGSGVSHPGFAGSTNVSLTAGSTLNGTWTFSYANPVTVPQEGTYQTTTPVTYTITVP